MAPDRHAVEKQRFARLLGLDDDLGCGLPIGGSSAEGSIEPDDADDD